MPDAGVPKSTHAKFLNPKTKTGGHLAGGTPVWTFVSADRVSDTDCFTAHMAFERFNDVGWVPDSRRLDAGAQPAWKFQHSPQPQGGRDVGDHRSLSTDSPSHVHVSVVGGRGVGIDGHPCAYGMGALVGFGIGFVG